jgi:hypothetical protein
MAERFPIFKCAIYNTTKPENTNSFSTDLAPSAPPSIFLAYYAPLEGGPGGIPLVKRTNGTNTVIEHFPFQFTWSTFMTQVLIAPGDSINFIMPTGSGSCGIGSLIVVEIDIQSGDMSSRRLA